MEQVDINDVKKRVMEMAKNGSITCTDALAIAAELNIQPRMIGKAANLLKLKIVTCQLGCFK